MEELFNKACALEAIKEGDVENIVDYLELLGFSKESTVYNYNKDATTGFKTKVQEVLSLRPVIDLASFKVAIEEATVLAVVQYTDSGAIKSVVKEFYQAIGIENPSESSKVYNLLNGEDYDDYAELKKGYEKAYDEANGNDDDKKPSKKPSSSGGGMSTIGVGLQHDKEAPIEIEVEENVVFNDLDNVEWAVPSIMALYGKGIIAGKSEKTFAPNDPLTREQFVTMIVNAFGLQEGGAVGFSDVLADAWYYKYVNAAYNNNITKGMGDAFGIGIEITRQDMAVMVYNAVKNAGLVLNEVEEAEEFADAAEISDYAKEAVSALQKANVINGMGNGSFNPKGVNTRAQAAVVINSVLNAVKEA